MRYTQKEILEIQRAIVALNIPFNVDVTDLGKVKLTYKFDKNIFASLTKILTYEYTAKNSHGKFESYSNPDFAQFLYYLRNWLRAVKNEHPFNSNRYEQIEKFSPRFYIIFEEAKIIRELGFEESAGMIFRKATEVLIKDFWFNFLPTYNEVILNETVGKIVFFFYDVKEDRLTAQTANMYKKKKYDFIESQDIINEILPLIEFVNKTFKIGNDFSHYERKLEHFNAKDIEANINQILGYLVEKYQIIEAQRKLKLLDNEFQFFEIKK